LLTNNQGNVYHEDVEVVDTPSGNNQMAAKTTGGTLSKTLPKDRNWLVGYGVIATVTNLSSTVTITKNNHGLTTGDTVTVSTSAAIGGISAVNLSVSNATITVATPDTFTYTAGASASSNASGYLDYVTATTQRTYTVGDQSLEIYLNGELLLKGRDYTENGTTSVLFTADTEFNVGDVLSFRIDSNGGQVVILAGGASTLQLAYNGGNNITIATGVPVTLTPPGGSENLLTVNGDMTLSGVLL
jgi:hypothetical protein